VLTALIFLVKTRRTVRKLSLLTIFFPPGVDKADNAKDFGSKVPVKEAEITLAIKEKSLPETESEWNTLHHLQHCCTSELTNFQASQLFKKFENEDDTVVIR
jgi:hypothetical protein